MLPKRGRLTLVFDDGYEQTYQSVLPLLRRFKLVGVFALPLNHQSLQTPGGDRLKPYQAWQALTADGHELAAHSINHRDLTTLPPHELEHELAEPAKVLPATTIVYPGGAINQTVTRLAKKYYRAGRTVKAGFESTLPPDPFVLHSFDYTRHNFHLGKANARAIWAYLTDQWLIETYHLVTDQPTTMTHAVGLKDFTRHLAFISRLPLVVTTIKDTIE